MSLSAISNANGWEITLVGIGTVFFALFLLYLVISNLHKIIILWENKDNFINKLFKKREPFPGYEILKKEPYAIIEQTNYIYLLSKFMGNQFSIHELRELAKKRGVEISDKCIKVLVDKEILIPIGRQKYMWNE